MKAFEFPMRDQFLDRVDQLDRLEAWWSSAEKMPINLYGRRRVGKSWLFRMFADGKPAQLLVAHKVAPGAQLSKFAKELEPLIGVVPDLPDLAALFTVLFRAAQTEKLLVVIDEFPWLLPSRGSAADRELTKVQAVFEQERDASQLKLILCGSEVRQMEALQCEKNPMHGRLIPMHLQPLPYPEAALFLTDLDPIGRFERYAIAGGMPRYLSTLGSEPDLRVTLAQHLLSQNAPLWDEAKTVLEQELKEPRLYFAVLETLSTGDKQINEIAQAVKETGSNVSKYLDTLEKLGIVSRRLPIGSDSSARNGQWHLLDAFFRFWFRFVFPFQDELESGLAANDLFDGIIAESLNDHVAGEFERWCQRWTRTNRGTKALRVGSWWGPATTEARDAEGRHTDEIDVVGLRQGKKVTVVGEAKWRNKLLDASILNDLRAYKIPALEAAGFKLQPDSEILLFSRSGYTQGLIDAADADEQVTLVDVTTELAADTPPTSK